MATVVPNSKAVKPRKTLGIRATAEESRILSEAAKREHRSVNSFVLQAAMNAAQNVSAPKRRPSSQEIIAILSQARAQVGSAIPSDRDILEEFLNERRAEARRDELE